MNEPVRVTSFREFEDAFGGLWLDSTLGYAMRDFFANGGTEAVVVRLFNGDGVPLTEADFTGPGKETARQGLYSLEKSGGFNLLCLPPHRDGQGLESGLVSAAAQYCETRRAFLVLDPPISWTDASSAQSGIAQGVGTTSANAAIYFPRLMQPDPLRGNRMGSFAPSGAVAGVIARTDARRGVWKAPAGMEATLQGVTRLSVALTDSQAGALNTAGVNCLRTILPAGPVVWGARTLQARQNPEWKYVNVRRLALFVEESIERGTQWAVFEPNGAPLWEKLRAGAEAFLFTLWQQGALQGAKAVEAYFVKCDRDTMTQSDIDNGRINMEVGIAPVRPSEFVILRIHQTTEA